MFFFSSRRRHTRCSRDWSSDVCSSDLWWLAYNLESPEALIKVFVSQSKCFTLLDRGKGLAAAQQERALAGSGEMRGGANIGKGQMKAADYVLLPDVVTKNSNPGGRNLGGLVGWLLGGLAGAVGGGIRLKRKNAGGGVVLDG